MPPSDPVLDALQAAAKTLGARDGASTIQRQGRETYTLELDRLVQGALRRANPAGGGTALRRKVPAPARAILDAELVDRRTALDVGCGHTSWGPARYDPHHAPDEGALGRRYNVVTSLYVLCVIADPAERQAHLDLLSRSLAPGGRAYVAVRTDDACDGGRVKKTTKGHQVCRRPEAWAAELRRHFTEVHLFERGSGYVTFVATDAALG